MCTAYQIIPLAPLGVGQTRNRCRARGWAGRGILATLTSRLHEGRGFEIMFGARQALALRRGSGTKGTTVGRG